MIVAVLPLIEISISANYSSLGLQKERSVV